MTRERLRFIAEQVLCGKKLQDIDFGEPNLGLDEKLRTIDFAIRHYPTPEAWAEDNQKTLTH